MAEKIIEVNDDNFEEEVMRSDKPVMVDFWAPWCGPCKAIAPTVVELEKSFGEKVKFVKVNVDENPITPSKFGIQAIPTLIFFKAGEVSDQITGMVSKEKIEESVKGLI
ncbi:MAG: thioredoxin [Desulfobacteraceae bacterium]